jgi:hypothetical protein
MRTDKAEPNQYPTPRSLRTLWLPQDVPLRLRGITVKPSDGEGELARVGESWVHRKFTVLVERESLPVLELDIEIVGQRFRCRRLEIRPRELDGYVETRDLSGVAIDKLIREAVDLASYITIDLDDAEDVEFVQSVFDRMADLDATPVPERIAIGERFRFPAILPLAEGEGDAYFNEVLSYLHELQADAPGPRRRGQVTDEQVAEVYRSAYLLRGRVIDAVADAFSWSRQTAKNRIREARRRGLLPATVPGKRAA